MLCATKLLYENSGEPSAKSEVGIESEIIMPASEFPILFPAEMEIIVCKQPPTHITS